MSDSRSYLDIIKQIEKLRDEPARADRVRKYRDAYDLLSRKQAWRIEPERVIIVTGTNGKGSVSKTLETLLATPGRNVGLYTSPHMMETTERIRTGGRDLTRDEFERAFQVVEPVIEGLGHFEIVTLMMGEVFFGGRIRPPVDLAILEVGVGGRLDPTRVFPHATSVITSIGLDHEDLLGATLDLIAREKFAIVDEGNRVIVAPVAEEARLAYEDRRRETKASYIDVARPRFFIKHSDRAPVWVLKSKWGEAPLALKGRRAVENTAIALQVCESLGEDVSLLLPRLEHVTWPCRMEGFEIEGRDVYLSGDHNAPGADSLAEIVRAFGRADVDLIVGLGRAKRVDDFLEPLMQLPGVKLHLTKTTFRGGEIERYGEWRKRAVSFDEDPVSLLKKVIAEAPAGGLIVVTGSLYLTGDLRSRIVQGAFGQVKPIK